MALQNLIPGSDLHGYGLAKGVNLLGKELGGREPHSRRPRKANLKGTVLSGTNLTGRLRSPIFAEQYFPAQR